MDELKRIEQGRRLALLLKSLKITQVSLAQQIGVSQTFVNKMLKGEKGISGRVINELSTGFKEVNLKWLLHGEGEMFFENDAPAAGMVEDGGERYAAAPAQEEEPPPALVVTDVTPLLRLMEQMREDMRLREAEMKERIEWLERRVRELEAERNAVVSPI